MGRDPSELMTSTSWAKAGTTICAGWSARHESRRRGSGGGEAAVSRQPLRTCLPFSLSSGYINGVA